MPNTPMNFMASGVVWSTMTIASMNPNRMPARESKNRWAALFDFIAIISHMMPALAILVHRIGKSGVITNAR
jgi:hypothetical protein